ncbi:putative ribonuclease H-like domain-containing protein [Tanacetum coccineum]
MLPLWTSRSPPSLLVQRILLNKWDSNHQRSEEKKAAESRNGNECENNEVDDNIVLWMCLMIHICHDLEEISRFSDAEDDGAEAEMTNLDTHIVSPIHTTIIDKDHPVEQIIGDIHSTPQTRRMKKSPIKKGNPGLKDPRWMRLYKESFCNSNYNKFSNLVWIYHLAKGPLMDVKSAFLYGKIKEEVYVCQPPGFEDLRLLLTDVLQREKALYGCNQSSYKLDDIIFSSTKKKLCTEFEKMMHKKFQMSSIGELTFFLGLQVKQKEDGIFISQDKYVIEILKKFGFSDVKTASTPMETHKPLLKDADGEDVDKHLYRSMIGSLMYLNSSRPDIMFRVCVCARFQVNLKDSYLYAVKRIFRYLKGQPKLGLWYPKDSPFDLVAYIDSDYAGASSYRKSITGGCQFLGRLYTKDGWNGVDKLLRIELGLKSVTEELQLPRKIRHQCRAKFFVDSHNMVAYMEKSIENANFPEICRLPESNPIRFMHRLRATHRNTESSGRRDLQFDDKDGTVTPLFSSMLEQQADMGEGSRQPTDPQHTSTSAQPFNEEQITNPSSSQPKKTYKHRKPKKVTKIPQFSEPTNLVVDEAVHEGRGDSVERAATTATSLDAEQDSGVINLEVDETKLNVTFDGNSVTKLSERVLDLETIKTAQAKEIANLKKRVKKLERKRKSRTPGMNLSNCYDANSKDTVEEGEVQVPTADMEVNTASASVTTAGVSVNEDLTIAQTLMKMKSEKSKVRGVTVQEPSKTATRPIVSPPQHDPKDKGKAKMIEPKKPLKRKAQIKFDEEVAQRLHKSKGELSVEEKSRLFVELMDKRKKHFARLKAEERRRKPPTKAQKRNQIRLFNKTISWIDSFVHMDSEVVKGNKDKAKGSKKRTRKGFNEESVKRQKLEDDAEKAELKLCLEIVPYDDKAVNFKPLATKSPIVDWKTQILGEEIYYLIKRADGSYKMYKIFSQMLNDFDRQGLIDLYRLVTKRFKTTRPEGSDRLISGDLMTIFKPSEEDELWRNQQDYTLIKARELSYSWEDRGIKRHLSAVKVTAAGYRFLLCCPVTTEENVQKKNDMKARSMLLMALPNEHLMTCNQVYKLLDLFAAIQTRFLVLQKIVKLTGLILGENISQEDLNCENFESLLLNETQVIVITRVKWTLQAQAQAQILRTWLLCHLLAVLMKLILLMELVLLTLKLALLALKLALLNYQVKLLANLSDDTVYAFLASQPNGSQVVNDDLKQIHKDDIEEIDLKWQLALLIIGQEGFF